MHANVRYIEEPRWTGLQEVLRMAWPIVLSSLSWTLMSFVDTWMVSKLGTAQLAAVGSANLWAFTMNTFVMGVAGCVSTFVAQSLGRGNPDDCARYAWQGLYLSLGAILLAALLWPLSGPMFGLMPHSNEVVRHETDYFQIRLLGYVFIAWQTALTSFFQAVNRPMIPMVTAVAANLLNVLLDYLLIFGVFGFPRWEVKGAAAATVIALGVQCALLLWLFLGREMNAAYATRTTYAFCRDKCGELFRVGWPAGLNFFLDVANWGLFTSFIVGRFGDNALAAHNSAIAIMHLSFLPAVGLNQAIAPIVGQWIGKGDFERANARTYTTMKIAIAYQMSMGVFFVAFGYPIIGWFNSHPEVMDIGYKLLLMACIFQGFDAINITLSGALRGAGDTRWMAVVSCIGSYLVFLPLAVGIAVWANMGAIGAWIGATIYISAFSAVFLGRWRSGRWREISIFNTAKPTEGVPPEVLNPVPDSGRSL